LKGLFSRGRKPVLEILESTLRLSVPLIFAAMGGFLCERSGIATICLEGILIAGAWAAATTTYFTHSVWLGLVACVVAGGLMALVHVFLTVTARADHIVSGVAVNLLAAGLTPLFSKVLFGSPSNTPSIPIGERFQSLQIPFLSEIPVIGNLLFNQKPLVYLAFLLPIGLSFLAYRTGLGMRLMASGDGPEALKTAGISPSRARALAVLAGGMVASFGGAFLSTSHASQFTRDMTAGRGYIALAALIFGQWRVYPTLLACLFFGFTDALQIRLQSEKIFDWELPVQFIQAFPYAVTLFVLVVFIKNDKPPRSIGKTNF
jgi:general nucleoside transport system permease protein